VDISFRVTEDKEERFFINLRLKHATAMTQVLPICLQIYTPTPTALTPRHKIKGTIPCYRSFSLRPFHIECNPNLETHKHNTHDSPGIQVTAWRVKQRGIDVDAWPCGIAIRDTLDLLIGRAARGLIRKHLAPICQAAALGQVYGIGTAVDVDAVSCWDIDAVLILE